MPNALLAVASTVLLLASEERASAIQDARPQITSDVPASPKPLPVSLERIRDGLAKARPGQIKFDAPAPAPVATFRTGVVQRVLLPPPKEWLAKQFELTPLQRQSAEWSSRCCGLDLSPLFDAVDRALQRRRVRKIREQIARELADLEARTKAEQRATSRPDQQP